MTTTRTSQRSSLQSFRLPQVFLPPVPLPPPKLEQKRRTRDRFSILTRKKKIPLLVVVVVVAAAARHPLSNPPPCWKRTSAPPTSSVARWFPNPKQYRHCPSAWSRSGHQPQRIASKAARSRRIRRPRTVQRTRGAAHLVLLLWSSRLPKEQQQQQRRDRLSLLLTRIARHPLPTGLQQHQPPPVHHH